VNEKRRKSSAHAPKNGAISLAKERRDHDDTRAGHLPLLTSLVNAPIITGRPRKARFSIIPDPDTRYFFGAVLSKNETCGESFTRARVHGHLDRQSDVTNHPATLLGALIKVVSVRRAQTLKSAGLEREKALVNYSDN